MDMWKFFAITHKDHTVMNPMSLAKTQDIVDLLRLDKGSKVLDIACGKAEFLCRLVERYYVLGTGVDASPFTYAAAVENVKARRLEKEIDLHNMDGAAFEAKDLFDLASCIGGSWIFHGHKGTLEALAKLTKPGGLILVGEPFWRKDPCTEYLKRTEMKIDQHGTHIGNIAIGEELGLSFLYTRVSNEDDWDHYEGQQWQAAERYALANEEDPDKDDLLKKIHNGRDAYLRWGRDCLGWAMYLFLKN